MKKRVSPRKLLIWIVAAALLAVCLFFLNAFFGNPGSWLLARVGAAQYLSRQYPATDYQIQRVYYNFKNTGYVANIVSPTSPDSHFDLHLSMGGRLYLDTYESDVPNGQNTYRRLNRLYEEAVQQVLQAEDFPYEAHIDFGRLQNNLKPDSPAERAYGLDVGTLVLDGVYDMDALGARHGELVMYVEDATISFARAAEILLGIRQCFDEAGVPFYAIDLVLSPAKTESSPYDESREIRLEDFLYSDIVRPDLEGRITQAHQELTAYYREQDEKKLAETASMKQ